MAEGVMMQVEMFQSVGAVPVSERRLAQEINDDIWYDDAPGTTVAKYMATAQHPRWDWCTSGLWVTVERHFGTKPHRWMAEVYLELPDDERSWWSAHALFAAQDEAAREAADMAAVGLDLLRRHLRGDRVQLPGQLKGRAAQAYAEGRPEYVAACAREAEAKAALIAIGANEPGSIATRMQWESLRSSARAMYAGLIDEFCEAHSWREFAWVPHVAR